MKPSEIECLILAQLNRSPRTAGSIKSILITVGVTAERVDKALESLKESRQVRKQNSGYWEVAIPGTPSHP